MDWAERIRAYRNDLGLSQEQLGQAGQSSGATIRAWENGSRPVTVPILERILIGTGSSLAKFFSGNTPAIYAAPEHAELHRKLQEVLESGGDNGLTLVRSAIESAYSNWQSMKVKKKKPIQIERAEKTG